MRWTLVVDPAGRPGWQNMAIDQALLDLAVGEGRGVLRLYRWAPHCLSFGRHEPALRRYDRAAVERLGLDAVRRPTGGRAVWHADEVTYAVAAPAAVLGSLPEAYHRIHAMLAEALRELGAPVALAGAPQRTPGVGAGACFASPAGGEILLGGRKVVGSAQVRERDAVLQHGAILLGGSQAIVAEVTRGTAPADGAIGLRTAIGESARFEEVALAVARAAGRWEGAWSQEDPGWPALEEGVVRHGDRYRNPDWTWHR